MSKFQMLTNASPEVDFDVDLDDEILDEEILGEDAASLSGLDYVDTDEETEVDGLGYVGLGRARRSRKGRARRARRAKARRSKRSRRSRRGKARRARKARASRPRRRRKARRVRVAAAPKATKRRRSRRRRSAAKTIVNVTMPKVRRARRRRSAGRRRMSGVGTAGFGRALGKLADTVALQSISGLGKAGKKRRSKSRRRKGAGRRRVRAARRRRSAGRRKVARRSRRKGARRARRSYRGMGGLGWGIGSLGRMGASLADAEVKASWPVVGPFQYAFSSQGLEALGGVTLAGIVQPLLRQGVFARFLPLNDAGWKGTLSRAASVATSAVVMWELGRLLGSGNLAKFGAFYAIGRGIEEGLTKPYVISKIPGLSGYGLGQARIPDQDELRDLGYLAQARIPDQDELRGMGQRIVTEEELLGDGAGVGESDDEESNVF